MRRQQLCRAMRKSPFHSLFVFLRPIIDSLGFHISSLRSVRDLTTSSSSASTYYARTRKKNREKDFNARPELALSASSNREKSESPRAAVSERLAQRQYQPVFLETVWYIRRNFPRFLFSILTIVGSSSESENARRVKRTLSLFLKKI